MSIKKLEAEKLNELEENLINSNCMDLLLFNLIEKVEFKDSEIDETLLSDFYTLSNESHLSIREKEICYKYIKILIDRNNEE